MSADCYIVHWPGTVRDVSKSAHPLTPVLYRPGLVGGATQSAKWARLSTGIGARPGHAQIWRLNDDGAWRLFAGFGHGGSWGSATGTKPLSSRNSGHEYVYRLIEHEGHLVAGFGARPGCAQVWRFTPENDAN